MANTKISALPAGAPAQATDVFPVDRAGTNVSLTVSDINGAISASDITTGTLPVAQGGISVYGWNDYAGGVDGTGADQVLNTVTLPAIPAGRGFKVVARFHTTVGSGTLICRIKVGTTAVLNMSTVAGTAREVILEVWNKPGVQNAQYETAIAANVVNTNTTQSITGADVSVDLSAPGVTVTATSSVASGTSSQAYLRVTSL